MYLELERELAEFLRKDAVITFSTGFQFNLGIISAIVGMGDYVNPVLSPACTPNECLICTSLMATHTYPLLDEAADILAEVMKDEK